MREFIRRKRGKKKNIILDRVRLKITKVLLEKKRTISNNKKRTCHNKYKKTKKR